MISFREDLPRLETKEFLGREGCVALGCVGMVGGGLGARVFFNRWPFRGIIYASGDDVFVVVPRGRLFVGSSGRGRV